MTDLIKLPKAVLFDLDGTLLDTANDLGAALNHIMSKVALPHVEEAAFRPIASNGAAGLLALGFGVNTQAPEVSEHRQAFLDYYNNNIATHTCAYPGIQDLLSWLDNHQVKWGIVTNKPEQLTLKLLSQLEDFPVSEVIIGGDTYKQRKPHPYPLEQAARALDINSEDCWYVGDALRDIEAANAAKMYSVVANWGYIQTEDNVSDWQARAHFNDADALLRELTRLHQQQDKFNNF